MEIHELQEKKFKIIIIRIFNELKHRIDIPLNEIRKTIHKLSEIINDATETWKTNQTEILEHYLNWKLHQRSSKLNLTRQKKNQQTQRLIQEGGGGMIE